MQHVFSRGPAVASFCGRLRTCPQARVRGGDSCHQRDVLFGGPSAHRRGTRRISVIEWVPNVGVSLQRIVLVKNLGMEERCSMFQPCDSSEQGLNRACVSPVASAKCRFRSIAGPHKNTDWLLLHILTNLSFDQFLHGLSLLSYSLELPHLAVASALWTLAPSKLSDSPLLLTFIFSICGTAKAATLISKQVRVHLFFVLCLSPIVYILPPVCRACRRSGCPLSKKRTS